MAQTVVADTIAAIATPPGMGGVGIVRVSGSLASDIARAILGRVPRPRVATFASFLSADGSPIDRGIALYFPAPRSFTGQSVLELQGHGGPLVLDLLLERCLQLGARSARPGEFTERAFLNGKIDLVQAEAVADLIASATTLGARLAARNLHGDFSRGVAGLIEGLVRARAYLEATLDFPDDEIGPLTEAPLASDLDALIASAEEMLTLAHQGERIRSGLRVVIGGPPNAGKSSLLNALAQADAAIVTPIPGTTRDVLERDIQIDGLPVRLADTAGIRATVEPVEREGVRRALEHLAQADLILWVYDGVAGFTQHDLPNLPATVPVVLVRNKIDLAGPQSAGVLRPPLPEIPISALTGDGLPELRAQVRAFAGATPAGEGAFMARRRHLHALTRGLDALRIARAALGRQVDAELVALDLQDAQRAFGEITGEFTPDDLLDRIFSTFCIGK